MTERSRARQLVAGLHLSCRSCGTPPAPVFLMAGVHREHQSGVPPDVLRRSDRSGWRLMLETAVWLDADIEISATIWSALEWRPEDE